MDLKGKVAIVTGARRGIGRGIALTFAKAGAKVVVSDVSQEDCEKVVKEIEALGSSGLAVKCDVSQKSAVEALVKAAVEKFGRLDVLVNNAGIISFEPFLEMKEETWDKIIDVNLKSMYLCSQAAAKEMVKQGGGKIVNVASIEAFQAYPMTSAYAASKAGVVGLTKAMALELAPSKINVNAIAPGAIDTPMAAGLNASKEVMEQTISKIPWGRIGKPEDVANAALFLASEEADYVTGATLVVDGGWTAHF
jgi:NAD(P)-dependent dehydrogenase (short-subunit alcohol dehydrogenase family)